jgi:hypothetical protein
LLALSASVINLAGEMSLVECVELIAQDEKFFTTGLMYDLFR